MKTNNNACRVCTRDDLSLTANGRIRSHAADGKRPGPDNPHCPGGSGLPRDTAPEKVTVTASGGPNPHRAPLPPGATLSSTPLQCRNPCSGNALPESHIPGCPQHLPPGFDPSCENCIVDGHACPGCGDPVRHGHVACGPCSRPYVQHTHRYQWADDENGHSGSFCSVCDAPEPEPLPHDRSTNNPTEEDPWQTKTRSTQQAPFPAPGSTPRTNPSATVAVTPSMKATSSGPTETADTRDRTAAVTEAPVQDAFESVPAITANKDKLVKRDRWGRYLLPHPETGKRQGWTRATTMAKSISDTFALSQWSQRMVLKGASSRPDLVALAGTLDVKRDKDRLNGLVDQAKDAAGQKVAANLGTAVHSYTEHVDGGGSLDEVPAAHRADVLAYQAAMTGAGLYAVPHLIERITVVPEFGTAGTLDRILRTSDGEFTVGDVKTGRDLQYGWQEIAIQLALYAHGVNASGVWDLENEQWEPDPLSRFAPPGRKVSTEYGIVMHLPIGESTCTLYRVNLRAGWAAASLCASVRDWRKTRELAEPYAVAEPAQSPFLDRLSGAVGDPGTVTVRPSTWEERFAAVSSRGEAAALYPEAVKEFGPRSPVLAGLVKVAQAALAALEEGSG